MPHREQTPGPQLWKFTAMAVNEFNFSDEGPELKGTIQKACAKGGSGHSLCQQGPVCRLGCAGKAVGSSGAHNIQSNGNNEPFHPGRPSESTRLMPRDGKAQTPAMFCQGIKQRRNPRRAQDSQVQGPALEGMKRNSVSPEKLFYGVGWGVGFSLQRLPLTLKQLYNHVFHLSADLDLSDDLDFHGG